MFCGYGTVADWVIVVLLAAHAWIFRRQANSLKQSVDDSREKAVIELRAYITIEGCSIRQGNHLNMAGAKYTNVALTLNLINTGKTPARNIRVNGAELKRLGGTSGHPTASTNAKTTDIGAGENRELVLRWENLPFQPIGYDDGFNAVVGVVEYENIFEKLCTTPFSCEMTFREDGVYNNGVMLRESSRNST